MNPLIEPSLSLLIPTVILIHLFWAPYTKVEESFNIQAIHDILTHGVPTQNVNDYLAAHYDHVSFPGSVPRTFVGALVLSGLSRPWVQWITSPAQLQVLVRAILGLYNAAALLAFRSAISRVFGKTAGNWFVLLQASQFHLMYYASRTLPNTFALGLSTLALRYYLLSTATPNAPAATRQLRLSLYLLTVAGVIFRSELALLVGTFALWELLKRISGGAPALQTYLRIIVPAGLGGLFIGLVASVSVDSFFWRTWPRPLWPEWSAFAYNTLEGRASDWGVSPWHYYIANAVPRLLLNPLAYTILIPIALLNPSTRARSLDFLVPSSAFVALYSLLPHKEWRFIIYIIPALTAVSAAGASWLWIRRAKTLAYRIAALALSASLLASFAISGALLAISSSNYPGGTALRRLHDIAADHRPGALRVHLDNLACQTGVTHFLEEAGPPSISAAVTDADADAGAKAEALSQRWTYDKTDDPERTLDPLFWTQFDYALAERPEKAIGKWEVADVVYGFGGVKVVRPGEVLGGVEGGVEEGMGDRIESLVELLVPGRKARGVVGLVKGVERVLRERVTRGWWVGVRMVPRISVLRRV